MTVRMQVGLKGDEPFLAALREAAKRGEDMTPLMDSIGLGLVGSTRERFAETSLSPAGSPWPPSIDAEAEGRRTLVKSGNLADSITHEASANQVVVGTNVQYAGVHQFGATISAKSSRGLRFKVGGKWVTKKEVTIPARSFIGISAEDGEMILGEALDFVAGAFEGDAQ